MVSRFSSEKDLISGLRARDQRAWNEFTERYSKRIYAAARNWLSKFFPNPPEEDINTVYQLVFEKLIEHNCRRLATFQGKSSFATWLSVVAGRIALEYMRGEKQKGRLSDIPLNDDGRFYLASPKMSELQAKEIAEVFEKAISELKPVEQIIIRLFYFRDMDHAEIADVTGVSQNSVSPMLTRAREKLRDILERGGYKMEDFLYK
ncbi:MAG: RNA polymerase sigma factor [Planctomycetota bacterium]